VLQGDVGCLSRTPRGLFRNEDIRFPCWKSQSFHLHSGGGSHFSTQAMSWKGSFRTFIVHGPWTDSKSVLIWLKIEQNTFWWHPEMEIPSFSQRTWLGPVCKRYCSMGLQNDISLGTRKKHIRIRNKFKWVDGVKAKLSLFKFALRTILGIPLMLRPSQRTVTESPYNTQLNIFNSALKP